MLQQSLADQQQELSLAYNQLQVENQHLSAQLQQQRLDDHVLESVSKELQELQLVYNQLLVKHEELIAQQQQRQQSHDEIIVQTVAQAVEPVSKELYDLRVAHSQLQVENQHLMAQQQRQQQSHDEMIAQAVAQAVEPVSKELQELRLVHSQLQVKHEELMARTEPFIKQLEGSEAEKQKILTNYTQLIGHTNTRQKIQHLSKLKDDILELRKVIKSIWTLIHFNAVIAMIDCLQELEKEKKLRAKAEARVKELASSSSRNRNINQQDNLARGREPFRELILQ